MTVEELTQKLYEDDGHCGNVYKKAPPQLLHLYENRACHLIDDVSEMVIEASQIKNQGITKDF